MKRENLNKGIIYTNSNCIGCNKCISGCIAPGANVVVDEGGGTFRVKVDPDRCILCGQCMKACVHSARTYRDDTERFFEDLMKGEQISILVAPSLLTNYEQEYHNILGYLKSRGVNHVYNVAFGADVMTWAYIDFINSFGLSGVISQSCPVIVNYLEKYRPELLKYLVPVQSPMMCTAIYVSDYLEITDKLAFIGPCIAKKQEIDDVNTYKKVSYNITFERLMEYIGADDISGFYAEDEVLYGLGVLVPKAGGLSANIEAYIGFDQVMIKTSGPNNIFPYFDHYASVIESKGELPFLVDAMSCTNGCYFGTGTNCGAELNNKISFATHRSKEKAYRSGLAPVSCSYQERLDFLNKRFEDFALSSFVRQYGQTRKVHQPAVSKQEYEAVFQSMYKDSEEQRHVDCGSCGYKSCWEMAYAICTGLNLKQNCINYSKEHIRRESEITRKLLEEISAMNEELVRSDQTKSNFLANMSHELRTPMNTVIGMAEIALRGELPEQERGYIQQIKESGRSLMAIINDILDFSKIESGKMELNEVDYPLLPLIKDMIDTALIRIGERDVMLIVDAEPDIPAALCGDDIRIKQVISNLISNAAKFTEKGFVRITFSFARKEAGEGVLTVSVDDSGIGIKKQNMEKLFTSFQQLDSKRNRSIEGTGLGLAISREFVQLMKGTMHVESVFGEGSSFSFSIPQKIVKNEPCVKLRAPKAVRTICVIRNQYVREGFLKAASELGVANRECLTDEEVEEACEAGADFIFVGYYRWDRKLADLVKRYPGVEPVIISDARRELSVDSQVISLSQPVYSQNLAAVLYREESGGSSPDGNKPPQMMFEAPDAHILIVDDNNINLTVATGLLMPLKMNVDTASNGADAVAMVKKARYDIIFMDHMMPGMDGVEATHIIRGLGEEYFKKVPIIALTANAINSAKEMFLSEGMSDFVAKPIDMKIIISKLQKWLPVEKIIDPAADRDGSAARLPEPGGKPVPVIEQLDVEAGLAYTGSVDIYWNALEDYFRVIEDKAALIESSWKGGDYKAYTVEVHALKSASRLVGATGLAELAALLEQAGKDGDAAAIDGRTEELLRAYRSYRPVLEPWFPGGERKEKEDFVPERLNALLEKLTETLEDFDIDGAKECMGRLEDMRLPEEQLGIYARLQALVGRMEYDEAEEAVEEWKKIAGEAGEY